MSQMPGAGELQQTALAFIQLLSCKKETQRCVIQKSEHAPSLGPEVQTELPIQGPWFRSIVGKVHSRGTSTSQEGSERFSARNKETLGDTQVSTGCRY